jgi:hypothetical protein
MRDNSDEFKKSLKLLRGSQVLVGVPRDGARDVGADNAVGSLGGTTKRRKNTGKVNNAVLAYVHNNGSPAQNIPARATIAPGIKDAQDDITNYMKQAGKAALDGKQDKVENGLSAAGIKAVVAVKKRIRSNTPPKLSERTLAARRARGVTRTNTLVDTGQYLNAHTFVVKMAKGVQ